MPAHNQRIRKNKKKLREQIYEPAEQRRTKALHEKLMNLMANPEVGTPPLRPEIQEKRQQIQEKRKERQMLRQMEDDDEDMDWKEAIEKKNAEKEKKRMKRFREALKAGRVRGAKAKRPKAPKGYHMVRTERFEKRYQFRRPIKVVEYKPVKIDKKRRKKNNQVNWNAFVNLSKI